MGGSQVTRVVCPGAVAGEQRLSVGGPFGAPSPPGMAPSAAMSFCVFVVALGITRLAIFFLACRVSHQGHSNFPCLSCLPFGSTAWVPLPDWPDPCWSGWARPFGSAAFAPGVSLAKDRHIVGEPMRAFEAGQELLCLDAWGPVLRACLLARCDRAIPTSRPGARPWDRVALHAVQPVLNIYIYIYMTQEVNKFALPGFRHSVDWWGPPTRLEWALAPDRGAGVT